MLSSAAPSSGSTPSSLETKNEATPAVGSSKSVPEAKPLPDVPEPPAAEVARHRLTHVPYKRWCKYCVMARMLNTPHWTRPAFSRAQPLLVMDYCFVKHAGDERFLTCLVGRVYPSMTVFASPCAQKGPDSYVTRRLAGFLKACGLTTFNYMCDQEGAIRTMITEVIEVTKSRGEWIGAIPEHSPVGESQSNGRAERAVQQVEDQVRTLLCDLEERLGHSLKPHDPVLSWMIEYAAVVINKYQPHESTGSTAYMALHGKDVEERLAYFGEKVYFHVPKRRRSNLDCRWGVGIFLGTLMTTTEVLVGIPSGDVIRTNSVARLVPSQRWDLKAILKVTGTPAKPQHGEDDAIIESFGTPSQQFHRGQRV